MSKNVLIGRQPILDRKKGIFAYEILFRMTDKEHSQVTDNLTATSYVLTILFNNFDMVSLLGDSYGFINVDESILNKDVITLIPSEKFFLEILETVDINENVLEKITELKKLGYKLALDDYICNEENFKKYQNVFKYFDVIKFDILEKNHDFEQLKDRIGFFKENKIMLLAEKVETKEDYRKYKELGFDLFQGFFFSKPAVTKKKMLNPSQLAIISIINKIEEKNDSNIIAQEIKKEPEIALNLLNFINSPFFYFRKSITSLRQAISMLGLKNLKKWLFMLLYSGISGNFATDPLLILAKSRAEIMSKLAKILGANEEKAYLTGLLSLLDVIFETKIEEVLEKIKIDKEIKEALIQKNNIYSKMLELVATNEQNQTKTQQLLTDNNINLSDFNEIVCESYAHKEML
jgi:EAL and modified HD-GYP domain-containing signal transduction protein